MGREWVAPLEAMRNRSRAGASQADAGALAAEAGEAIVQQLKEQGGAGSVWIPGWGQRYEEVLGTLRAFLESNPNEFTVIPGQGGQRQYSVQLARGSLAKRKCRVSIAIQ